MLSSEEYSSLVALAKLGHWALTEQFADSDEVFYYSTEWQAVKLGLLSKDKSLKSGNFTPLAKLPENLD
jgi:hypothetical protein